MGTILERKRKDGTTAYLAQVSIMRKGVSYRESETFDRRTAASQWIKNREAELKKTGVDTVKPSREPTLADAIDKYLSTSRKAIGRTKAQVLDTIKAYDISASKCSDVDSAALVSFATELAAKMQPQTVGNYLSHLGAVFAIARPAWKMPLDQQAMKDAVVVAKKLGITGKSIERKRRPTLDELERLMNHYRDRQIKYPGMVQMTMVIAFAIFSTRRQDEIVRITWGDLETEHSRVLVRDMKNPGEKIGNDVWCDLPAPALRLITATPAQVPTPSDRIFPYTTVAISSSFTKACALLGIEDLHFHDLRHEGVSRLFEMGLNIPHAAAVSGHRSWASLKRYTHMRQVGDKYEAWPWLAILAKE